MFKSYKHVFYAWVCPVAAFGQFVNWISSRCRSVIDENCYQADVGPLSMQWIGQQQEQWKIIFKIDKVFINVKIKYQKGFVI